MADYAVLPETLNFQFIRGDEFGFVLDFGIDLTGYTLSAVVYEVGSVTNGINSGVAGSSDDFTITPVDLSLGKVNLSLSETQTQEYDLGKQYRWFFRWVAPGAVTRTVIAGAIQPTDP